MAVAVECLVKLLAFLAAGIFVTYFMFDGFGDIFSKMAEKLASPASPTWPTEPFSPITWTTYFLLAMSAIMFLPRQFHVSVVENFDEKHIRTAIWLFPLYMILINIFVLPIAMAGLLKGYPALEADTYVLALPMSAGQEWLSLLVFLGGGSAATGMIMISSITVSTMITNHLMLPVVGWIPQLGFLRRQLLKCRWVAVVVVILIGYWFERTVGESYMLVNIGMISFAAALQFAPSILGGIFWPRGNETGALLGMGTGFFIWFYTLLVPAFVRSGWISDTLLREGPFGIALLRPEHLFGTFTMDALNHTVCWSLFFNIGLYIFGSLCFKQSEEERSLAEDFVGALKTTHPLRRSTEKESSIDLATKRKVIEKLLCQYFREDQAASVTQRCLKAVGLENKTRISIVELAELRSEVEKQLAGSIGSAAAHRAQVSAELFTSPEERELSEVYGEILVGLRVTPEELKRKIDYYQEKEMLLTRHAAELEDKVKERTRDLELAQEELIKREKLSVLGQLTAIVSHELRNPLGVIRSSAFFLTRRLGDSDAKIGKHLNRIEEQVGICDSIIGELLEYTRGKRSEVLKGDINAWLKGMMEQMTVPRHVKLVCEAGQDLPEVYFDGERLRRVFINLFDNAVQAVLTRQVNETAGDYKPRIRIATARDPFGVRIEVEDNGTGMDDETAARAFEPLFTTRPRGTGLGLAIVRKVLEEHGGSVSLDSKLNRGTTIAVVVPHTPPQSDLSMAKKATG
jgi:signal transduction histidine kinase